MGGDAPCLPPARSQRGPHPGSRQGSDSAPPHSEATAACHPLAAWPHWQPHVGLGSRSLLIYLIFLDAWLPPALNSPDMTSGLRHDLPVTLGGNRPPQALRGLGGLWVVARRCAREDNLGLLGSSEPRPDPHLSGHLWEVAFLIGPLGAQPTP